MNSVDFALHEQLRKHITDYQYFDQRDLTDIIPKNNKVFSIYWVS